MTVSIELQGVEKHYQLGENTVRALRGADLTVQDGEFVAIMGPSGSGKSPLMNMIGALDTPTDGRVEIRDRDISSYSPAELADLRRQEVGFIFQKFNLIATMTAKQNVMLPMIFQRIPRQERHRKAEAILEQVGLGDRMDFHPNKLSGGEQQRVSIARALANDPTIILADE
ncbi:MAG: ABC transporter ATP-binding protein, partial [Candidatus Nanohaloarchaea archaeon]|nr:ABC transporter ATP-binding protein [Candidatus Nanohaloarchaea archaeon]